MYEELSEQAIEMTRAALTFRLRNRAYEDACASHRAATDSGREDLIKSEYLALIDAVRGLDEAVENLSTQCDLLSYELAEVAQPDEEE